MQITRRTIHQLSVNNLQAAIRGLVWALDASESTDEKKMVEEFLWILESELLRRGHIPADNPK